MSTCTRLAVAFFLVASLALPAIAAVTAKPAPGAPAVPSGMISSQLSNGLRLLAQPRYELEYAHVSVYLPLPPGLGKDAPVAARWLAALYLDTAAGEEDTPRQALATLDAVPSVSCTGRHLVVHLLCLPDGMPRALASLMETLATDRLKEPYWSQAEAILRRRDLRHRAEGWSAVRDEFETSLALGATLEEAVANVGAPPPALDLLTRCRARMLDPAAIRIILTGRGDVASAARLVLEKTAKWKKPPETPAAAATPAGASAGFAEWGLPADPPAVVVYLGGPGRTSPRLAAFLAACSLVADGATSLAGRMYRQGENWLPVTVRTRFRLQREGSVFTIELQAPADAFDEIERRLFTAAELAAQGQWLQVDLERARHQAFVHYVEAIQPTEIFHSLILDTEKPVQTGYFQKWKKALATVGKKDVAAAARAYITYSQADVLELPGAGVKRGFTAKSFREAMAAVVPVSVKEAIALLQKTPDIPLAVPAEDPVPEVSPEGMNAVVPSGILRGPEVLLEENYRWPLVWMCVAYPGGALVESAGQRGLNRLALWSRLLSVRDAQERLLLERLEMLGGRVGLVDGPEFSGVEMVCPSYFRRAATETLFRLLHRQEPTAGDVTRSRTFAALFGKSPSRIPAREAETAALATMYGTDSPYARLAGELEPPAAEAITGHYAKHFFRTLPLIGMTGQFQGTELLPVMTDFVAGSAFSEAKPPLTQPEFPEGKLPASEEGGGPSVVSLLLPGPYGGEADVFQMEVLRWLYLAPGGGAPPAAAEFHVVPLLSRGYLEFEYVAADKPFQPAADLLAWLKALPEQPINTWRLQTALKLTELDYRWRTSDPPVMARWLALNALWKSRLWDDKERRGLLLATNKEKVREMLGRFFTTGRYAIAAAPLEVPAK